MWNHSRRQSVPQSFSNILACTTNNYIRGKDHMRADNSTGDNKDCVIKVRVSESLKNKIHAIALRAGDTDSGVIRSAIEDAVRKRLG